MGGAYLRAAQELLGHSSIATTQISTSVPQGAMLAVGAERGLMPAWCFVGALPSESRPVGLLRESLYEIGHRERYGECAEEPA
jgi:hypothetical protein